jgi:hypothetical protein
VGVVAVALWCVGLGVGLQQVHAYAATAGAEHEAPASWPATELPRRAGFTLVMFVHAECPCSRASLAELATLPIAPVIVFVGDGDGASWELARAIPGSTVVRDPDGREAARFGAATSGATVVYDRAGALRFTGGITGSRGHTGDNVGRRAVADLLAGSEALATHAVFGCTLGVK